MKYQSWIKIILAGGVTVVTVACGGNPLNRQSNPMKDYSELSGDVPPAQYNASEQKYDGVLFDLQVDGQSGNPNMDFYEGKEQTYRLISRVFVPGLVVTLKATNLPKDASLTLADETKGIWLLKWNPGIGTIPRGSQRQSFPVQIAFEADQNSSARARSMMDFDRRNRIKNLNLNVYFSDSQPKIRLIGLERSEFKLGEVVPFQVEVSDGNITKDRRPEVHVTYDRANLTAEAKTFPASSSVLIDHSKQDRIDSNGKWTFHYLLDTTTISPRYLQSKERYEGGEFIIYAMNPSTRLDSTHLVKRFKVQTQSTPAASASGKKE